MTSEIQKDPVSGKLTTDEALAIFSSNDAAMPQRRQALSVLIGGKFLPKQADDVAIEAGLWRLILRARGEIVSEPVDQLMAMAECARFVQVVKKNGAMVAELLQPAFTDTPLPPSSLLADADDRLNLARACALAPHVPWIGKWMAQAVADEETGEKARSEMLGALLVRTKSLNEAMAMLVQSFSTVRPNTESPGDTLARRLTRTLSAWRSLSLESELPAGNGLGSSLHELLVVPLGEVGSPESEKVKLDLCEEALLTVHDLVRSRASLVTDGKLYQVVAYCKRLCGGRSWPPQLDKPRRRLVADVAEALLLLGRQGQRDQQLLEQLTVLTNNQQEAKGIAHAIAHENTELPEEVRDWLIHGRVRQLTKASGSAQEFANSNADGVIGLALNTAQQLIVLRESLARPLEDSLEIYEPSLVYGTRQLLEKALALAVLVEQACALRNVTVHGEVGQETDASAKFFDVIGGATPRLRMTVKQPAVVRLRPDQSIGEVLVRGLVE